MVVMVPVQSSNVKAVGFDAAAGRLHVQFNSGGTYSYPNWTQQKHDALLAASSIGGHLHRNVISNPAHPHTKHA